MRTTSLLTLGASTTLTSRGSSRGDKEVLDLVEDEDDIPAYTGRFDYSDF